MTSKTGVMKSYKIEIKTGEEVETIDLGLLDDRLTAIVACDTLYYERCRLIGDYARVCEVGTWWYHSIEKGGVEEWPI